MWRTTKRSSILAAVLVSIWSQCISWHHGNGWGWGGDATEMWWQCAGVWYEIVAIRRLAQQWGHQHLHDTYWGKVLQSQTCGAVLNLVRICHGRYDRVDMWTNESCHSTFLKSHQIMLSNLLSFVHDCHLLQIRSRTLWNIHKKEQKFGRY